MLIECPECEGKVSDKAVACPHCGLPEPAKHRISTPSLEEILRDSPGASYPGVPCSDSLDMITAEAIDFDELETREKLRYAPNEQTPYTGWAKWMHDNGRIRLLFQYKDGEMDGLSTKWYENGQKSSEQTYKDGNLMTAVGWKPNGEKCPDTNLKDGNGVVVFYNKDGSESLHKTKTYKDGEMDGLSTTWYENGQKHLEQTYKDSKLMTAVGWKLNGEKCPDTNVVDGNGVLVYYLDNGAELFRRTYKDGVAISTDFED